MGDDAEAGELVECGGEGGLVMDAQDIHQVDGEKALLDLPLLGHVPLHFTLKTTRLRACSRRR